MTKTYTQILKQIETLKAEAEKLRSKEVDGVIERIRDAITHYGLTAADLGLTSPAPKAPKTAAPNKPAKTRKGKAVRAAKYRDDAGNTWVGRGKRPEWLRSALAAGKTLADFEIK